MGHEVADIVDRPAIGPYRIIRPLEPSGLALRWLAVHDRDQTSHVAHEFSCRDRAEQRRLIAAFEEASALDHPGILRVEQFALADAHVAWLLTPYTGNHDGLTTVESLLREKGGRMSPDEGERAIRQVLRAMDYAHRRSQVHGSITCDEVLVDRRGRVSIELYGLRRRLHGFQAGNSEVVRDEVRSVVEMGYRLLTALPPEEPRIPAGRLIERLDTYWDEWFDIGLDAVRGGFATAEEAADALPSFRREQSPRPAVMSVRRVLGRVRAALRQGA